MATKENKGGMLRNEQVEQDLEAKGRTPGEDNAYQGSQDNGDKEVRQKGTTVQKADGNAAGTGNGED